MMHRHLDEAPPVSSYKLVELQKDGSHWSSRFPGQLIYPFIAPFIKGSKPQEVKLQVWQMSLWNPSILSRNLFCWYSPAQVLIMLGMDSDNIHVFLPLSIVVAMQVHFLVSVYQSYVKDKQVLFGEVHREYNDKFVHPRIFVRKFDKQVSTGTDTGDLDLRTSGHGRVSSQYVSDRNPKRFNYLKVPVSSSPLSLPSGTSRFRGVPQSTPSPSTSRSSRSSVSMDSGSEEDEYGEESEEEEEEEEEAEIEEEEDEEEGEEEDEYGIDPDVDYDEEGEEPAVPHPTNALHFGKR
ncbi:Nuclear rim protein 1 [Dissophora ornata]|nr:Nuclear rim protein 1 [Dissophora ornata]